MSKFGKFLIKTTLFIIVVLALFLTFVYYFPYSDGFRSGELIKLSKKGVIFKTWEGEISQGISGAQIFKFSVLDKEKEVIQKLKDLQGNYVKVKYVEKYITFPFWGDTKYFITDVEPEESPHFRN